MATAYYWSQWNHVEIMSMHGIELTHCHSDIHYNSEEEEEQEEEQEEAAYCCSSGCMNCLGFSWRDFM